MSGWGRFALPGAPWARVRSQPDPQDDPDEPPDDQHTVEVEQPDGTVVYARPEAAHDWREEAWRDTP